MPSRPLTRHVERFTLKSPSFVVEVFLEFYLTFTLSVDTQNGGRQSLRVLELTVINEITSKIWVSSKQRQCSR